MTTERQKSEISFICDGERCGTAISNSFGDFQALLEEARDEGWRIFKRPSDGQWVHLCPICKGEADEKRKSGSGSRR